MTDARLEALDFDELARTVDELREGAASGSGGRGPAVGHA